MRAYTYPHLANKNSPERPSEGTEWRKAAKRALALGALVVVPFVNVEGEDCRGEVHPPFPSIAHLPMQILNDRAHIGSDIKDRITFGIPYVSNAQLIRGRYVDHNIWDSIIRVDGQQACE
jgi:hypothetical protein